METMDCMLGREPGKYSKNDHSRCYAQNCAICGFNPAVAKARKKMIAGGRGLTVDARGYRRLVIRHARSA
jgi:hypothetical protein